jgi:hypothetical protein
MAAKGYGQTTNDFLKLWSEFQVRIFNFIKSARLFKILAGVISVS